MKFFKHKHRYEHKKSIMVSSLVTGVPVQVANVYACRCGDAHSLITPAGHQQIGWGADPAKDWPGYV